jgi:bla regulator protein BlaR1
VSAFADHLWQSTLFCLAAGLSTWILRKYPARVRYWLWFAATVKFLIPFSLLLGIGSHLAWMPNSAVMNRGLYLAANQIGQPFTQPPVSLGGSALATIVSSTLPQRLPAQLAGVWFCGFGVILSAWYLRWRRMSVAIRKAVPLHDGREVRVLRRMERIAGIQRPIAMFLCTASLEPGIFGVVAPVLLWPKGISAHLEDAHLEAVVAHEVWHVRRRDNLAGALHMVVEALFWFHPLVWWVGARLVDERERACDEKVLDMGSERRVYAESILKTCQFCAGFSLACLSGVTGADLKKRIVAIMTGRVPHELSFCRKVLLGAAGLAALALPILLGTLNAASARAAPSAFEVLQSSRDTAADTPMLQLLRAASIPGATCPNSTPPADPFTSIKGDRGSLQ